VQFPLELKLQASRLMMASVLVAHVAAALALFHVPGLSVVAVFGEASLARILAGTLAWVVLCLSLVRALRAERSKRGCSLWLEDDGLIEVLRDGAEQGVLCRVRPHSAVTLDWAVWFGLVVVEPASKQPVSGARTPASMMLLASNVQGQDWRLLRIWLRHRADRAVVAVDSPG
jgi:hypothetical protein